MEERDYRIYRESLLPFPGRFAPFSAEFVARAAVSSRGRILVVQKFPTRQFRYRRTRTRI